MCRMYAHLAPMQHAVVERWGSEQSTPSGEPIRVTLTTEALQYCTTSSTAISNNKHQQHCIVLVSILSIAHEIVLPQYLTGLTHYVREVWM